MSFLYRGVVNLLILYSSKGEATPVQSREVQSQKKQKLCLILLLLLDFLYRMSAVKLTVFHGLYKVFPLDFMEKPLYFTFMRHFLCVSRTQTGTVNGIMRS